jgi:hypothetical protein
MRFRCAFSAFLLVYLHPVLPTDFIEISSAPNRLPLSRAVKTCFSYLQPFVVRGIFARTCACSCHRQVALHRTRDQCTMITRNRVSTALINTVPAAQSRFLNSPAFGWPSRKSTSPKSNRKAIDQSTDSTRTATEASNNVARDLPLESGSSLPSPSKRAKKATKTTQLPESVASTNPTSSSHCETESGDTIKKPVKVVKRSIKSKAIDDSEVSDAKQEVNAAKKPGKKTIEPGSLKPPEGFLKNYSDVSST